MSQRQLGALAIMEGMGIFPAMPPNLAWLVDGKLFRRNGSAAPEPVESEFADEVRRRLQSIKDRNEWKSQGAGANFMGGRAWGGGNFDVDYYHPVITAVCAPGDGSRMFYALRAHQVGAILCRDLAEDHERRMIHRPNLAVHSMHASSQHEELVLSVDGGDGTMRLALFSEGGGGIREITEGDSVDTHPSWAPGKRRRIVYQSQGIARDRRGFHAGLGPAAIMQLDCESGDIDEVLTDPRTDYLSPRHASDGTLWFIRRPWNAPEFRRSAATILKDIVFFPFRLLRALFGFLDFFSRMFSGKPLKTAGGPPKHGVDPKQMMLLGRMVDVERNRLEALRSGESEKDAPAIVPRNWELCRRDANADIEVMARGVVAFSPQGDGTVVYSNGSAVFSLKPGEKPQVLQRVKAVCEIVEVG